MKKGENRGHRIGDYKALAGKFFLFLFSLPFCYVGIQFAGAALNTLKQVQISWPHALLYFLCCLVFGGYGFSLIWLILSEIRISKDQKGPGKRFPDKTSEDKKTRQISYARGHWVFGGCWNLLGAIIFYSQIDYLGSLRVGQILSTSIILIVGLLLLISAIHKTIRWRKSAAPSKGIDTAGVVAGMSVLDSTKQGTGINRLRLGRWLLFGGMLVAVPYYIHVKSFSGKEVGRFVLADRERMGNITFTAEGNQLTNQVGPIELGPDMNPLRVVLYVESAKRSVRFHLSYTVRMLDNNGAIVWEQSGKRGSKPSRTRRNRGGYINPKKNRTIALDPFNLEKAGQYTFLCTIHDKGKTKFSLRANLAVRKAVNVLNLFILVAGGAFSLIGLGILLSSRKEAIREYNEKVKENRRKEKERDEAEARRIKRGEWGKWRNRTQIRRASPGQIEFCQLMPPSMWMGCIVFLCGLDIAFFHISIPFRGLLPGLATALAGIFILRTARGVVIDSKAKKIYRWLGLIRKPFIWHEDDVSRYETLEIDKQLGPKSGGNVGRSVHYRLYLVTRDKKRVFIKPCTWVKDARALARDISELTGLPIQDNSGEPPDKKRKPRKEPEVSPPPKIYRGPQKLEDYVREHIVEIAEDHFPDNLGLEWNIHGFEYRNGMTIAEVEPDPDEVGYSRFKLVVSPTASGDVDVDAIYCLKDGVYSLLCHSFGSGGRFPQRLD